MSNFLYSKQFTHKSKFSWWNTFILSIRAVILHSMRLIPMLDQLRKGLQLYELPKIMKTFANDCYRGRW